MKDRLLNRLVVSAGLFAALFILQVSGSERIIVRGDLESNLFQQTCAENGVAVLNSIRLEHLGVSVWEVEVDKEQIISLADTIQSLPAVAVVETDILYNIQSQPNDPGFSKQWNLGSLYSAERSNRQPAIGASPVVALIDTGIDANHRDLQNNLWQNSFEILNGMDDDGNGWVDDIHGMSVFGDNLGINDPNGHGTLLAGVIGATTNNGIGVASVCPESRILAIQAFDEQGTGRLSDILVGFDYLSSLIVRGQEISVLNLSWGSFQKSLILEEALNQLMLQNVVVVAAAGDYGVDIHDRPFYPASYDGVISVSAEDDQKQLCDASNYGATTGAPGKMIYSTLPDNQYGEISGTSVAAANVSGWMALEKMDSIKAESAADLMVVATILAEDATTAGFEYAVNSDNTITITNYSGEEKEVVIPDTIAGLPVVAIGDEAFAECHTNKMIIPYGVVRIGIRAFYGCSWLKKVVLPDTVISIGSEAFLDCYDLADITLPPRLTMLEDRVFANCKIKEIVLPSGITHIGSEAFMGNGFRSIVVPETVTSYGQGIFRSCWKLSSITFKGELSEIKDYMFADSNLENFILPSGVKNIGNSAFLRCEFDSITIPPSVTSIGEEAFSYCSNLKNIEIPASVIYVGSNAFNGCRSLNRFSLPANMIRISDGMFQGCESLEVVDIPPQIKVLGSSAFRYCSKLTMVKISSELKKIEAEAFSSCHLLQRIIFEGDAPEIANDAFFRCSENFRILYRYGADGYKTGVWREYVVSEYKNGPDGYQYEKYSNGVTITRYWGVANEVVIPDEIDNRKVVAIGASAFSGNKTMESVSFPSSVKEIGDCAFWGCDKLKVVAIPVGVEKINYGVFGYCTNLQNVTIPSGVKSIGDIAFLNCEEMTSIVVPYEVKSIGLESFGCCYKLNRISLPKTLTTIGSFAFYACGLKDVKLPSSVAVLDESAFWACASLEKIELSPKLNRISKQTFMGCSNMKSIVIPSGVKRIEREAFYGCYSLSSIKFPETLEVIELMAFSDCWRLTCLRFPTNVVSIENAAFADCYLLHSVYFDGDAPEDFSMSSLGFPYGDFIVYRRSNATGFGSINARVEVYDDVSGGFLYTDEPNKGRIVTAYRGSGGKVVIPDSIDGVPVVGVGDYVFSGQGDITEVQIPSSVKSIGKQAFSGCSGLRSMEIPDSVVSIGEQAFLGCNMLEEINIPLEIDVIMDQTFSGCSNLMKIDIPSGVTIIGNGAFEECRGLKNIVIPSGITTIGIMAFRKCDGMESISLPTSIQSIGSSAFAYCYELKSLTIPPLLKTIESKTFSGCISLPEIVIPDGVTSLNDNAFSYCYGLRGVIIPASVTKIDWGAFGNCKHLLYAHFGGNAPELGSNVFDDTTDNFTVYFNPNSTGFSTPTWEGYPSGYPPTQ